MSKLKLHWERSRLPMLIAYIMIAMDYCEQNGIATDISIYESYMPLFPNYGLGAQYQAFELNEEGSVNAKVRNVIKFFLLSYSIRDQYIEDADKYPEIVAVYNGFGRIYPLLYFIEPDYNFRGGPLAFWICPGKGRALTNEDGALKLCPFILADDQKGLLCRSTE